MRARAREHVARANAQEHFAASFGRFKYGTPVFVTWHHGKGRTHFTLGYWMSHDHERVRIARSKTVIVEGEHRGELALYDARDIGLKWIDRIVEA